ncbi:MAG: hypothetical protein HY764_04805 [Candidatus Portnoybacteria bacterium]|nr:hypothetical protein [Candidatus Portnoybacteria bacterium]
MPEGIPAPTDDVDIQEYTLYLMTGTKKPNEHYTYGEDLEWQIPYVIKMFKKEGFGTNHCYMTVGRPETLYFYDTEVEYSESIVVRDRKTGGLLRARQIHNRWNLEKDVKPSSQCLRGIDVWVEDGTLNFWVYFRSWDLWGGFPVNLGGIQLVKEYMAAEIGVKDGGMIVSCKDLHVYEHGWFVALARLRKDASQIPGGAK